MRDPYEVLGVSKDARARPTSRAPSASSPRSCTRTPTRSDPKAATRFSELNAAYEIVGDDDKRKAFDSGEIDAEGKPRFQGFEGFGGRQPAAGRASAARTATFETFTSGPKVSSAPPARPRRRAAAPAAPAASRTSLKDMFGGARAARRRGSAPFEPRGFRIGDRGQDVTGAVTITLPDAAKGVTVRVRPADRQGCRGQDSGRPHRRSADQAQGPGHAGPHGGRRRRLDHRHRSRPHPVFTLEGADVRLDLPVDALRGRARRQGARADARQRGGDHDSARHQSSGRTFRLKGKGFPAKDGSGRPSRHGADRAAGRQSDAELEAADEEMAEREAVRSAQGFGVGPRDAQMSRTCVTGVTHRVSPA